MKLFFSRYRDDTTGQTAISKFGGWSTFGMIEVVSSTTPTESTSSVKGKFWPLSSQVFLLACTSPIGVDLYFESIKIYCNSSTVSLKLIECRKHTSM